MAYSSISCCYVPTKHIAYFLSSFFCLFFSFSLFICRCSVALSRSLQVSKHGFPRRHRLLRALSFIYLRFLVIYISCSYYGTCMPNFLGHCTYIMFLTMGVFTTSWWVVNQPIVMVIFLYAFYIFMLVCILPLEA